MNRIRPRLAFALLALVVATLPASAILYFGRGGSEAGPRCGQAIPHGTSASSAWATASLFVSEVVLLHDPGCGYGLSTRRLRATRSSREWADGSVPVTPFRTRYPPTPILRASSNPNSPEAVYVLSRKVAELLQRDASGKWTIPLAVGLAAPDAGMGAYRLVLTLEEGSWRVDRAAPVRLSKSAD